MTCRPREILLAALALPCALACGGDDDGAAPDAAIDGATGAADADTSPVTVEGTVVDLPEFALAGVTVAIPGHAPVVTDGSGRFTIEEVERPYDVLLIDVDHATAALYVGLTRPDPFLNTFVQRATESAIDVSGTLEAGAGDAFVSPNPPDTITRLTLPLVRGGGQQVLGEDQAATAFAFPVEWISNAPASGTLHALQYARTGGLATGFLAYGSYGMSLTNSGNNVVTGAIAMNEIDEHEVSGTITGGGDDLTVLAVASSVSFSQAGELDVSLHATAATTFEHLLPDVPGARGCVMVQAGSAELSGGVAIATRTELDLPATEVVIELPDVGFPVPMSPAAGAADVGAGSELVWRDVDDAVHLVSFQPTGVDGARVRVVTADDRAVLPDLAPYGVSFTSESDYGWRVVSDLTASSTDAVAAEGMAALSSLCTTDRMVLLTPARAAVTP